MCDISVYGKAKELKREIAMVNMSYNEYPKAVFILEMK